MLLFCSNVFMTFAWYAHLQKGAAWIDDGVREVLARHGRLVVK